MVLTAKNALDSAFLAPQIPQRSKSHSSSLPKRSRCALVSLFDIFNVGQRSPLSMIIPCENFIVRKGQNLDYKKARRQVRGLEASSHAGRSIAL